MLMLMRVWCGSLALRMIAGSDSVAMSAKEQGKRKKNLDRLKLLVVALIPYQIEEINTTFSYNFFL